LTNSKLFELGLRPRRMDWKLTHTGATASNTRAARRKGQPLDCETENLRWFT